VINYNTDDPYGTRDAPKWRLYLKAVPFYDLIVVLRKVNFAEAEARGAQKTLWVTMSVDEEAHARTAMTPEEIQKWSTDVLFVGTWMPERGPLVAELIRLGIPLSIYGSRWDRAKEWPIIQKHWRGPELSCDGDYARAIQCAKVCIGLVSKGNRDESTTRSFEIPYLGSVLCAYRTQEHTELYEEGREAVFWSTAEECAAQCRKLLADENYRQQVAENGRLRCIRNGATNEGRLSQVLSTVLAGQPALQKK
jgi:spore maturation protein CgeB